MHICPVISNLRATNMIKRLQSRILRLRTNHFRHTAHFCTTQNNIERITHIIECKNARRIVVTCIFPQPCRIRRIAIQQTQIGYYSTINRTYSGCLNRLNPTENKRLRPFQIAQRRIASTTNIQIAMQHAIFDISRIFQRRRKAEFRTQHLQCRTSCQQLLHASRWNHIVRTVRLNHFTRLCILNQHTNICLLAIRRFRQNGNRQ